MKRSKEHFCYSQSCKFFFLKKFQGFGLCSVKGAECLTWQRNSRHNSRELSDNLWNRGWKKSLWQLRKTFQRVGLPVERTQSHFWLGFCWKELLNPLSRMNVFVLMQSDKETKLIFVQQQPQSVFWWLSERCGPPGLTQSDLAVPDVNMWRRRSAGSVLGEGARWEAQCQPWPEPRQEVTVRGCQRAVTLPL